jgi:transcriptional regulator with XRE-family HTH domain
MFELGSTLREARTRQGLELSDVAEATRIRVKFLAALEGERFGQLPAEVYARAFLRTYAEFLGLEGDVYVAELSSRLEARKPPPPPPPPEPRLMLPSFDWRAVAVLGGVAAVVLVAVLAWHDGGGSHSLRRPAASSQVTGVQTTIAHRPAAATRATGPAIAHIVLVATRGDCWLSIRAGSRDGRVIDEQLLRKGATLRVAAKRLWIRIGAPWNLEATLNGRVLRDLPTVTGNIIVTAEALVPA